MIVLHNLFFLILGTAVYLSLMPLVEDRLREARERDVALYLAMFASGAPPPGLEIQTGSAEEVNLPSAAKGEVDAEAAEPVRYGEYAYRRVSDPDGYERLTLPADFYAELAGEARIYLFVVLGAVYVLAVITLEGFIMPRYVYRPLRLTLEADQAAQAGRREEELIPKDQIAGDEIGDIMRSRNETLQRLREQEANLELAERSIAAQDRLASIGLLSASVAHELNTPLSVLSGSIEQLQESVNDGSTQTRLDRMQRVTGRLRKISEGLLDFAANRRNEDERHPVLVRELVAEAWNLLAIDEAASQIELVNEVESTHQVLGNSDRLMQVLINLLRNAMYALEPGGKIVVHSEAVREDSTEWVRVTIDDSGPGIPEDVLPNIFEAFVTTRLDARGTGLGLTVAHGIVQRHGGELRASNRPEGGARLEMRLPVG